MDKENNLQRFYEVLKDIEKPDSAFLCADFSALNFYVGLKYTRVEFISDIEKALSIFPVEKYRDITSLYGFSLEHSDSFSTIIGYPSVENLNEDDCNTTIEIYSCVQNFTRKNEVYIENNVSLSNCLNNLINILPEFLTLIGKAQHRTHSYTVDVHTLKVLQGVMKHPDYLSLSLEDKRVLQMAVLMHDITKKEGQVDKSHPACSANDAYTIFDRLGLSKDLKNRICLIIKHHDWLERYNKGITSAEEFADILKNGNDFLMLCILAESDLQAVQRDGRFYDLYKDVLKKGEKDIKTLISAMVSAA